MGMRLMKEVLPPHQAPCDPCSRVMDDERLHEAITRSLWAGMIVVALAHVVVRLLECL